MASRFWVGGTGTWDASDTTHWAASSGGAGGQSVPGSGDTVTLDGASGGGTVTVNATISVTSITAGAFTGTLDFSANNNNVTAGTVSLSGAGARTINLGNGVWTITGTTGTVWDNATVTNETLAANSSNITFAATATGNRTMAGGSGKTYATVTVNDTALKPIPFILTSFTITTLVLTSATWIQVTSGNTLVVTNAFSWLGTATVPKLLTTSSINGSIGTLSVGAAVTMNHTSIFGITKAGAGSIVANDAFDLGSNTGITIIPPGIRPSFSLGM